MKKTVFAAAAAVAVAWSAQAGRSIEAFKNAGFEDVSKFHGEKNGVEPTEEGMLAVALLQASWGARGFIFYMWDDLFRGPYPERYEVRKRAMLRNIRKLRELEPFIMSGEAIEELRHKDVKGRTRAVKMSDGKGAWRVIVIGLGMDNEASFALPDGSRHTFRGGEFSCEIL